MSGYEDKSLDELKELARERDLEGRSGLNKQELADALAADDNQEPVTEEAPAEATDVEAADVEDTGPETVEEALEDNTEYNELSDEAQDLAAVELDVSGPLSVQSPYGRIITGAVNEEQAAEQEEERSKLPEEFVGDFPEKVSDKFSERAEELFGDGEPKSTDPADYIDFPPAWSDGELERAREENERNAKANSER